MALLHKIGGILDQVVPDATVFENRDTGARHADFTAIKPVYAQFQIYNDVAHTWNNANWVTMALVGQQSQESLLWSWAISSSGVVNAQVINRVKEFYIPLGSPILFDEQIQFSVSSANTGTAMQIAWFMYYEIVQSTELFMVQQIAQY